MIKFIILQIETEWEERPLLDDYRKEEGKQKRDMLADAVEEEIKQ